MKPMIRHCRNCKWVIYSKWAINGLTNDWCDVKYKQIHLPRFASRLCRYYTEKGEGEADA